MTRPASSLTPASYTHCWAGTRSSLLTCWLGVSQVGLVLIRTHPLGNNNQFHEITLHSKVSGLPWREQAMVRCSVLTIRSAWARACFLLCPTSTAGRCPISRNLAVLSVPRLMHQT